MANNAINNSKDIDAEVVECGCWKGQSAHIIASIIKGSALKTRQFHIFDSFEGLSDYTSNDLVDGLSNDDIQVSRKWFAAGIDMVKENLKEFTFAKYYRGWIPTKFHEVKDRKFCFVNVDVDLFQPISDSLEFFYPRLISGGTIFIDDYAFNQFPGASKAVDDFVTLNKIENFVALPTGGAYLIK